jgi:hypothetical protein
MFDQQDAKNRQSQPQEGIVELSDEQLEDVAGGRINYDARIQYLQGEIGAYQFLLNRPPVTVVNQTTNNNNTGSNSNNQLGVQTTQRK